MSRFSILENEINKNLKIDTKSNEVIRGWSPNNVRRLVIGYNVAVVQYFATGGKYGKRVEVVNLEKGVKEALIEKQSGTYKQESIITVLTKGRVCSSIEEIVFCVKDYPKEDLNVDANVHNLVKANTTLESRFPRLRHIYLTTLDIRIVADLLIKAVGGGELLHDEVVNNGGEIKLLSSTNKDTWYKGTALRPKYYPMDEEVLKGYFEKVQSKFEQRIRDEKLKELSSKDDVDLNNRGINMCNKLSASLDYYRKVNSSADKVFNTATIIQKAEWAKFLDNKNLAKLLLEQLQKNNRVETEINTLSVDMLDNLKASLAESNVASGVIYDVLNVFTKEIGIGALGSVKKNRTPDSIIDTLHFLANELLRIQYNVVLLSLASYLNCNTLQYVKFNKKKLKLADWKLTYTSETSAWGNKHLLGSSTIFEIFDEIGLSRPTPESRCTVSRSKDILEALGGVDSV